MVLVVLGPDAADGEGANLLGVLFAFGAALCQTGYALIASRGFASVPDVPGRDPAARLLARWPTSSCWCRWSCSSATATVWSGPLDGVDAWTLIVVAGVFSAALPTAGLVAGYRRVGPTRGAVLMLLEPVTGVLLAALWLAERPAPVQLLGGLLVLLGAALVQLAPTRHVRAGTEPGAE